MNANNPLRRELLYEETVDVDFAADTLDLERLRRTFAPPFDRAAHAVQTAGYEQDDAVIERYLICRFGSGNPIEVPAASLADPKRFFHHLVATAVSTNHRPIGLADLRILGLRVKAVLEQWNKKKPGGPDIFAERTSTVIVTSARSCADGAGPSS